MPKLYCTREIFVVNNMSMLKKEEMKKKQVSEKKRNSLFLQNIAISPEIASTVYFWFCFCATDCGTGVTPGYALCNCSWLGGPNGMLGNWTTVCHRSACARQMLNTYQSCYLYQSQKMTDKKRRHPRKYFNAEGTPNPPTKEQMKGFL